MVATVENKNDSVGGEKFLDYYLGAVKNPDADYIAEAILAELKGMGDLKPAAFSLMANYLRGVDTSVEEAIVEDALQKVKEKISDELQVEPTLEREFAAIAELVTKSGGFDTTETQEKELSLEQEFLAALAKQDLNSL
jgi:hypothetical protein